jgi:hypothetical protein
MKFSVHDASHPLPNIRVEAPPDVLDTEEPGA